MAMSVKTALAAVDSEGLLVTKFGTQIDVSQLRQNVSSDFGVAEHGLALTGTVTPQPIPDIRSPQSGRVDDGPGETASPGQCA
jgi:hypothetical protein